MLSVRPYRGPSQGCNGRTQGVTFCDWAGRVGPIFCHAWEQGEGWPGSRKATNVARSPASASVNLFLDISFGSNHVKEVWREWRRGKKEGYGDNSICKKHKRRKLSWKIRAGEGWNKRGLFQLSLGVSPVTDVEGGALRNLLRCSSLARAEARELMLKVTG